MSKKILKITALDAKNPKQLDNATTKKRNTTLHQMKVAKRRCGKITTFYKTEKD